MKSESNTKVFFAGPQRFFQDSLSMLRTMPDFDAVIGTPRSGTTIANFFASILNTKVGFVDTDSGLVFFDGGYRVSFKSDIKKVLLVEDSTISASFISKMKPFLKDYEVKTACVYVGPNSTSLVDYFGLVVGMPRIYYSNLLNHVLLRSSCVDLDGILCFDPTEEENDDGEKYRKFILSATSKFKCRYEIHSVVTSRLEKYRTETQEWLFRNNIKYNNLVMSPHKTKQERIKANDYAIRKADYFLNSTCDLFIESDDCIASEIARLTERSVICSSIMKGYNTR